ncbi:MAG: twin-arginine translocation signal domain-containing protein, partial [Planctomycetota bacterium]
MASSITRREFLKASAAGSLMMASPVRSAVAPKAFDYPKVGKYQVYFGDLHNHSEVGYARGSLDRAFEIAAEHLDFFAFTPHGYWHDISTYENNIENKWLNGFEVTKKRWPEVLAAVRKYDREPGFVPMAGFEWHSTS